MNNKEGKPMEITKEDYRMLMRNMLIGRKYDEAMIEMFAKTPAGMWHSGIGHEAVGAGVGSYLRKEDKLSVTHRGLTEGFSKGLPGRNWLASRFGRMSDFANVSAEWGILPRSGTIGGSFPIATGAAIALKNLGTDNVVVCLFGDGASHRGTMHESMNMAAAWKLPVIWVCENNLYSITTPISKAMASEDIVNFAHGYSMPGISVDGQDVIAVTEAVTNAVKRARAGNGPSLIECKTYRYREHGEGDIPTPYRTRDEVKQWKARDPINLFRARMINEGWGTEDEVTGLEQEAETEVETALAWARAQPEAKIKLSLSEFDYVK
jgi:TPP-dependent pyruvate/acetoin dehydrogenase alpha subunit